MCLAFLLNAQDFDGLQKQLTQTKEDTTRLRLLVLISDVCDITDIKLYADSAISIADDLLEKKVNKHQTLIHKATAINNLGFLYHNHSDIDKAIAEYKKSNQIFHEINDTNGMIMSGNNIGMLEKDIGNIEITFDYLEKALALAYQSNNKEQMQMTHTNLGSIYTKMGVFEEAITHVYKAIEIQEEIGDKYGKGYAINNLASLYYSQKDLKNAEKYFLESLEIRKDINDEFGVSTAYNNLAVIYDDLNKDSLAKEYYENCLAQRIKINNREGIAQSYSNIGSFYIKLNQYKKTADYFQKSIAIRKEIGDKEGLSASYQKMADFLRRQKKYKEAEAYGVLSLKLAKELQFNDQIKATAEVLSMVYDKRGDYKKAYEMHKLYLQMRDTLFNGETQKSLLQQQINYDYKQKKLTDSLNFAKEQEVKDLQISEQKAQLKQEKTQRVALYGGIVLAILLAFIMFRGVQQKKKANDIILAQKNEVESQKVIVDQKNKEITDSITYAKRIQEAILPSAKFIKELLPNSFVLYKPKDIVAGDFYWMEQVAPAVNKKETTILLAAADCTGHGVPGAMVSVVCHNAMNRAVREFNLLDPGEILDKTRLLVVEQFEKSEKKVSDGMDIALCVIDKEKLTLAYSGANNPLYIIRENNVSDVEVNDAIIKKNSAGALNLFELKATKQPIGKVDNSSPFKTHKIQLLPNDSIFIFTDGFADQFGGEKGKKFKYKPFKELLLSIQNQTMENQYLAIEQQFKDWKGELEQIDDICIIGLKI